MAPIEQREKLRVASQVHAEAVAIVALRAVSGSITDADTPAAIRERIKDLIAVKASWITCEDKDFDALLGDTAGAVRAADRWLRATLAKMRSMIEGEE
jgi:hypothetical protein